MQCEGVLSPGRNYIRPPPPIFLAKIHFPGEGGGGVYEFLRPPRQEYYTPPPFLSAPPG